MSAAVLKTTGTVQQPRRARARSRCGAAAATTAAPSSSPPTTALPLLPFFTEFRSQVARLEGVAALPVPPQFEAAESAGSLPLGFRSGACHSDRLRIGRFLYVNAGCIGRQRGRPRSSAGSAGASSSSSRGSLSLLQGELLPSIFSFHPPLAFQVVAFDGGAEWMISVDYLPLPSGPGDEAEVEGEGTEGSSEKDSQGQASSSSIVPNSKKGQLTSVTWQAQQAQRLAVVQGMYSRAAVALPAAALRPQAAGWPPPARLLLSSAMLQGESRLARRAALEGAGLPAFRAALSVHLNGLAAAPADASAAHVSHTAAAQRELVASAAQRPLLCGAQLSAAFGGAWVRALQDHWLESGLRGLAGHATGDHPGSQAEAGARGGPAEPRPALQRAAQQAGQAGLEEFVYFDPAALMDPQGRN